ncbi:hypothetical protein [Pseudonocardia ammonioxydans]|nr:hypothetical protein [Pseudonocardia ammonioxydans]
MPYSMDRTGRTYQGVFYYDIRQGSGTELAFTGSDGITRTLDITGL